MQAILMKIKNKPYHALTMIVNINHDKKPWLGNALFLKIVKNTLTIFGFHHNKQIFRNKYNCSGPPTLKSQSCRVRFSSLFLHYK